MNEIYALDPNSPTSVIELQLLAKFFGFSEGRFLAKYPIDWSFFLENHFSDVQGVQRLKLVNLIEKCNEQAIPVPEGYMRSKPWIDNAIALQVKSKIFKKIISRDSNFRECQSLDDILYGDELIDSRGGHIHSTIENYIEIIRPLLLVSTELFLQDVNLHFEEKGRRNWRQINFVKALFNELKNTNRCKKIYFVLNLDIYDSDELQISMLDQFYQLANDVKFTNIDIELFFVKKREAHARYIFSIKAGLQFDYGFDTPPGAVNHIHWLSKSELEPLLDKYNI